MREEGSGLPRGLLTQLAAFSPAARRFLAFSVLNVIAVTIFSLVFNLYMSALGFSNDVIGVFNALPALAVLLVGLPVGALADRMGYRAFLLLAGFWGAGAAIGLSLFTPRLLAVFSAGTFALAFTVLSVLGTPMLAQLSRPEERVALYAVGESLGWVGGLVGNLLGGYVPELAGRSLRHPPSAAASLRVAFAVMALVEALTIPLIIKLASSRHLRPSEALPVRQLLQVDWPRFARLLVPQAFLGMGAGMLLNFIQLYLAQRFGLSPGPIGLILALGALPTAWIALQAPLVSRRLGMSRTIGLAYVAGAPLVLILAFVESLPLGLVTLYVRQFVLNLQSPLSQLFGMEMVHESERARLASAQNVVFSIGFGGLGPLLSGFLQVHGGFQLAFSVSAAFYLVAGLTFLYLFASVRVPSEGP